MPELVARMSSKGQMTLPADVRRRLHLSTGDEILITYTDEEATLRRSPYSLEEAFASVPALRDRDAGDFDDLIEEAMEDHATWVVERMRRGEE